MMYPGLLEKFEMLCIDCQLALIDEYKALKERALVNWIGDPRMVKLSDPNRMFQEA